MTFFQSFSTVTIGIALLWLVSALLDYASYTYILQLKEYRIDRMKDFFKSREGQKFLLRPDQLWGAMFAFGLFTLFYNYSPISRVVVALLGIHLLYIVYTIFVSKTFRYPRPTAKAILIVLLSLTFETLVLLFTQGLNVILIVFVFRSVLIGVVAAAVNVLTTLIKKQYIYRATRKIATYENLIVIGITGSYGKSSVKEFTAHLLEGTYRVQRTPGNINTEIGIAKYILCHDFSETDVFVCEMGAYKMGEIKLMCDMVNPQVGIITAINPQHLALFGSIRNIQQAKYELLRAIPEDGVAITNADNPYCTEFLHTLTAHKVQLFGTDTDKNPDCLITNIKARKEGTTFTGRCCGEEGELETPVIGGHHAYNIAAAVLAAAHLQVPKEAILERSKTLPTSTHGSLQVFQYGEATIVDDSYNSNPTGFRAALDVLAKYPSDRKRIVITRGMLELADESIELHEQIGGEIAFVADSLVVITEDHYAPLKRGVGNKYQTDVELITEHAKLLTFVKQLKNTNAVILLENRMPQSITEELCAHRNDLT